MRKSILIAGAFIVILILLGCGYYWYDKKMTEDYKNSAFDIINNVKNNQLALTAPVGQLNGLTNEQFSKNINQSSVLNDYGTVVSTIDNLLADTDSQIAKLKTLKVPSEFVEANDSYIKSTQPIQRKFKRNKDVLFRW